MVGVHEWAAHRCYGSNIALSKGETRMRKHRLLKMEMIEARLCLAGVDVSRTELTLPTFGPSITGVFNPGVADLDGDQDLDFFAVVWRDTGAAIGWMENLDGRGTFGPIRYLSVGEVADSLAAMDVDSDGDLDLVYREFVDRMVRWHRNDSSGFQAMWEPLPEIRGRVFNLDVDSDGVDELMTIDGGYLWARTVNSSPGRFFDPPEQLMKFDDVLDPLYGNRLVDIDGDNAVEFVSPSTRFEIEQESPLSPATVEVESVFDIDGDGDQDLVGGYRGVLAVGYNDGSGEFSSIRYEIPQERFDHDEMYVADFDGDGDGDVLSVALDGSTLLLNVDGTFVPKDVPDFPRRGNDRSLPIIHDIDGDRDLDFVAGGVDAAVFENELSVSGSFKTRRVISGRPYARPFGIAFTDVNSDGRPELITVSDHQVLALPNRGRKFDTPIEIATSEEKINDFVMADIDADFDQDIVITRYSNGSMFLTNDGRFGTFPESGFTWPRDQQLRVVDIDGDGDDDFWHRDQLVFSNEGTFSTLPVQRFDELQRLKSSSSLSADFDGDGNLDVLDTRIERTDDSEGVVEIRYNVGAPEFFSSRHFRRLGHHAIDIHDAVPIDFDGDGDLDVTAIGSEVDRGELFLYENLGATFGLPRSLTAAPLLTDIESFDLDRDGDFDLILSDGYWFENDGHGQFAIGRVDEPWYFDLIVTDLDADSIPELVSWLPDESRIFVHRTGIPDRVIGDSNGDGIFNSSDLILVFVAAEYEDDIDGNSTFAEGDWDGDGDFTSSDLIAAFQDGSYDQNLSGRAPDVESLFTQATFSFQKRSRRGGRHAVDWDFDLDLDRL
ncbi:FG-GAP-like repeat-containing protein [Planctomycetota bacterium]